ncbi:MAG TPA: SLC13 family permease [Thermoanaerobaculia bacterium]|nr:SLC13 family permease [Thermoanaerobaculia bacterium]
MRLRSSESRWTLFLQEQKLVVGAGAIAAVFLATGRIDPHRVPEAVNVELLLLLLALILAVELLRESNLLANGVASVVPRFRSARSFTAASVLFTGGLSALVTNDVALFVAVPFTVLAGRVSGLRTRWAVMLQILAANLIGALTPLGNPQNLYVFHESGWSAWRFVATMAPFVAWSLAGILVALPILEPRAAISVPAAPLRRVDRRRLLAGLAVFALILAEILGLLPAWPAAILALAGSALLIRGKIGEIDLFILPLFFFAFLVVEGLRSFDVYRLFEQLPREPDGLSLYVTAILSSQIVSNVPATVLLAPLAGIRWSLLLYAVNAGGCGTMVASMANLIGWRLYVRETGGDPAFLRDFTILQTAFLAWTAVGGWAIWRLLA